MDDTLPTQVHVIDPHGNLGTMDASEAKDAIANGGYQLASAQDLQGLQDQQTYGDAPGSSTKAFLAGGARAASFGLSDQGLTKSGLVKPETLKGLSDYHPVATGLGEVAGIAAGMAAPELEGVGALGELANPVKAVSKLGEAAGEAAAPLSEGAAKLVANPETSPVINKMVARALQTGAGSAVEGAAYGLGSAVSEDALGDHDALGEKLLSHVGYNALLFGGIGGGIGAGIGAYSGLSDKVLPKLLSPAEKAAAESGDFEAGVKSSSIPEAEQKSILESLGEKKDNADEIQAAGAMIGAPVLEGQLSASPVVQRFESTLLNSPASIAGVRRQALLKQGIDAATKAVEDSVGQESALSAAETGDALKKSISDKFEQEYAPLKEIYKEIEPYQESIPVSDKSTGSISRNIMKILEEKRIPEGGARYNYVKWAAESLDQVKDLAWLKSIRSEIAKEAPLGAKDLASAINEKLNGVEERSIRRFADTMKTSEAKEKIMGLLDQMSAAKDGYKELRGKMADMGKALGKEKFYGPQDFLNYIDKKTPEQFLKKVFAKDNSQFLKFFQEHFPEESEFMMRYQRGEILKSAMKEGQVVPSKVFSQLDKMSPELKNMMFKPDELEKLKAARTWLEALPKNINPSGTAHATAFRAFFEHPTGAIIANVRDYGIEKFIKTAGRIDPDGAAKVAGLAAAEKSAQKQSSDILAKSRAIFNGVSKAALPVSAALGASLSAKDSKPDHGKIIDRITQLNSDPEQMINHLDETTKPLYAIAPKTASGVQMSMTRATQFLASKAPKLPNKMPMGPRPSYAPAEVSKFMRYYDTVQHPIKTLDKVTSATITPEDVETLSNVYPKLYAEMQQNIISHMMDHAADEADPLPYRKRQALSLFLGKDIDGSMNPQAILANQSALQNLGSQQANASAGAQAKVSQKGLSNISASSRMLTASQSTSQREIS